MKKNYALLALSLIASLNADTHFNKTFLMPRSQLRNRPMQSTTWHSQINEKADRMFGGSVQATVFYQESQNRKSIGKYFGYEDSDGVIRNEILVEAKKTSSDDLFNQDIFHNALAPANTPEATPIGGILTLKPRQRVWGVRFDWYQDLDKILNGLFFEVSTVVSDVSNKMNAELSDETNLADVMVGQGDFNFGTNVGKGILDFFQGNLSQTADPNKQDPLKFAKFKDGSDGTTELCDIEIKLGYNLVHKVDKHVGLNIALLIPTGNIPTGEFIFEAIGGHGDHWAFGGGFDTAFILWNSDDNKKKL